MAIETNGTNKFKSKKQKYFIETFINLVKDIKEKLTEMIRKIQNAIYDKMRDEVNR